MHMVLKSVCFLFAGGALACGGVDQTSPLEASSGGVNDPSIPALPSNDRLDRGDSGSEQGSSFRLVSSALVVTDIEAPPVDPFQRFGVLWRRFDPDNLASSARLMVQEISISGDFPNDFRIRLDQPPVGSEHDYLNGELVLLKDDAVVDGQEFSGTFNSVLPDITTLQVEAMGIESMPAVYVAYNPAMPGDPCPVTDLNFSTEPLEQGFHIAVFDGRMFNDIRRYYDCIQREQPDCGGYPADEPGRYNPTEVITDGRLNIRIGGDWDLMATVPLN